MPGTDRYTDALTSLREVRPSTLAEHLMYAQVSATLALAAATALRVVVPAYGDNDEVTQWAKLLMPDAHRRGVVDAHVWPEYWPPRHGDIWQDRHGARWSCQADLTLARLSNPPADDTANEIEGAHGPMALVYRPDPLELECPF